MRTFEVELHIGYVNTQIIRETLTADTPLQAAINILYRNNKQTDHWPIKWEKPQKRYTKEGQYLGLFSVWYVMTKEGHRLWIYERI